MNKIIETENINNENINNENNRKEIIRKLYIEMIKLYQGKCLWKANCRIRTS